MVLARVVPVMFADYAIVLEDRRASRAHRAQRRGSGCGAPGQAFMALFTFLFVGQLIFELFVQQIQDADGVFPGFFGAQLLVQALARLRQRLPADRAAARDAGRAGYCTRIRAPGVSFSGSTFGFSSVSASTVVLKSSAIDENDSPSLTR